MFRTRADQMYERVIAVLREENVRLQRQLDASLSREAEARAESVRIASAAAFTPPRATEPPRPLMTQPMVDTALAMKKNAVHIDPWAELPFDDERGTYQDPDAAALVAALGGGTEQVQ